MNGDLGELRVTVTPLGLSAQPSVTRSTQAADAQSEQPDATISGSISTNGAAKAAKRRTVSALLQVDDAVLTDEATTTAAAERTEGMEHGTNDALVSSAIVPVSSSSALGSPERRTRMRGLVSCNPSDHTHV